MRLFISSLNLCACDTAQYKLLAYQHIVYMNMRCDLKVSSSQAKIDKNFANYFLKTKANNMCFIVLKCTCKGLQQSISELER